ncbi:hypothetical protein D3C78_1449180 [compost metagenome]
MGVVKHADPLHLRQDGADQPQLPRHRRIAPQQAQVRRRCFAQAIVGLLAADAQHQGGRPPGVLQAPVEAGQVKQDQADIAWQLVRRRQVGQRGKPHAVFGAQGFQGLGERLHAGAVLGTGQQDLGGPSLDGRQPTGKHQA